MEYYYEQWKFAAECKEWEKRFKKDWPNFSLKEIAQRNQGHSQGQTPVLIIPSFLDRLQELRHYMGMPLKITSWYRSPAYNASISSTGEDGPHTTGRAVDIALSGGNVNKLLYFAHKTGFTGIGVKQKGSYSGRFIHLDDLGNDETAGPRPHTWSY